MADERKLIKNLSDNVTRLLGERGWNQSELARRSGLSNMEISRICNAKYLPNVAAIVKLAEALQVSVDFLLALHPELSQRAS